MSVWSRGVIRDGLADGESQCGFCVLCPASPCRTRKLLLVALPGCSSCLVPRADTEVSLSTSSCRPRSLGRPC